MVKNKVKHGLDGLTQKLQIIELLHQEITPKKDIYKELEKSMMIRLIRVHLYFFVYMILQRRSSIHQEKGQQYFGEI